MAFVTASRLAMLACCASWQLACGERMDVFGHGSSRLESESTDSFDDMVNRETNPKIKAPLQELQQMVGLNSVKASMERFMARMTVSSERTKKDLRGLGSNCMHMKFLGNPGTGKTVVARIIGKLMVAMDLIKPKVVGTEESNMDKIRELYKKDDAKLKGDKPPEDEAIFKEVSRSDLVAQYKGQTAPKVRAAIKSAFGGVLFIDEAYSLAKKGSSDFGKEAIDTLIKEMEDNREHVVVILAGYDQEMETLFNTNPGFLSRVPHAFHFDDYSCSQLVTIGESFLNSKNMHLGFVEPEVPQVKDPLDFVCGAHPELESCWWVRETAKYSTNCCENIKDPSCQTSRSNGNGRTIRNLLEAALRRTASRVMLSHSWGELETFDGELQEKQELANRIKCDEESVDLRCRFLQLQGTDIAKVAAFYMQETYDDLCGAGDVEIDGDDLMKMQPQARSSMMDLFRRLKWDDGASCSDIASAFQKTSLLELAPQSNSSHELHDPPTPCEVCMSVLNEVLSVDPSHKRNFWNFKTSICEGEKKCKDTVGKLKSREGMLGSAWKIDNEKNKRATCKIVAGLDCKKQNVLQNPLPERRPSVNVPQRRPSQVNEKRHRIQGRPSVHGGRPAVNPHEIKRKPPQVPRVNGHINVGDFKQTKKEKELVKELAKKKSMTQNKQTKADELMDKLEKDYIGLKPVKKAMYELKSIIEFDTWRKRWLGPGSSLMGQSFHMQFLGNPGTGKTVVARHIGKILFHLGVIGAPPPSNPSEDADEKQEFKFKEVSRADLVGKYIGATAKQVKDAVASALGGVLFIDEAYSLKKSGKKGGSSDQFGQEAVDELIKEMENNRAHLIVVLAGYKNEMKSFIESNPGFKSRVPLSFNFDDYTCDELMDIGKNQLAKKELQMDHSTEGALKQAFRISTGCCEAPGSNCVPWRDNGNGRTVRNVLEGSYRFMASRILVSQPSEVAQLQKIAKSASNKFEQAKTQYCASIKKLPNSPISPRCLSRTTPKFLIEEGHLVAPCTQFDCGVLSNLAASDVMNVLQETVYLNLHRLCSPGEGEAPEYNLADLKILVRVLPKLSEQDLTTVLRTKSCYEGTNLLKREFATVADRAALMADPPALDFMNNCKKECCEVTEVFKDIAKLIGLDKVKNTMRELYSLVEYSQLRDKLFLSPTAEQSFHMKFVGNPGTGKTVVARLVGELLLEMGTVRKRNSKPRISNRCKTDKPQNLAMQQREIKQIEKKGEAKEDITFIEASRADLVAPYLGQTAPKVMEAVDSALGGVLFIDEAYALVREGSEDSFGIEAVDTLIKEMEDKRAQVVVILAGYEKEMESFFASNPGFKSRVPFTFHFDDYKCTDLVKIGHIQLSDQDMQLVSSEEQKFKGLIRFSSGCCDDYNCRTNRENGNGRTVRNVVDSLVTQQTFRLSKVVDKSTLSKADYMSVTLKDLQQATAWLVADLLGRACSPAGRIKLVTDTLNAKQVTAYLDGSEDDLKPITNTIDKIVLARSVLQEQGLIRTDDVVFSQCEERMQAIAVAFEQAVNMICGPGGDIMNFHSEIQTAGKYSEYLMQEIKEQTAQAEALTLSLEVLKRKSGEQLGSSFADGSMAQTCKSSMSKLIEDSFKNVTVGDLLVWGH